MGMLPQSVIQFLENSHIYYTGQAFELKNQIV